jgi:hypothetical protein
MTRTLATLSTHDPVWQDIRENAAALAAEEPILGSLVHASVLNQPRFEDALNYILAQRLGTEEAPAMLLRQVFDLVISRPSTTAIRRANRRSKHCFSSRAFMPFRLTAWRMPCWARGAVRWRFTFRAGWR